MDLRHLRYFVTVAEEGHITRAAERLDIQQPPLSRLIKGIEQELDVQLFRRKPRGVELTEAGRAFLRNARAALANVDQAMVTARRTARGEEGRISIGVVHTAQFHPFVPRVIRAFRESLPLVSLTLEEATSPELVQYLREEQTDVAFIRSLGAEPEGLVFNRLLDEELVVAMPTGHPMAPGNRRLTAGVPLKSLAGESFLMMRAGARLHAATIAACHAAGFTPKVSQEVPRISSALSYVAAGLGIFVVADSMRRMRMQGVSYYRIIGPPQPTLPLVLASRRADPSPVVRHFIKLVRRATKAFLAA